MRPAANRRARECASHVAEEFGFEQRLRELRCS